MKITGGKLLVELKSGDYISALHRLSNARIRLEQVAYLDEITVCFHISSDDYRRLKENLKLGETVKVIRHVGGIWRLKQIQKHPLIVLVFALIIMGTILLPRRILFVKVTGNITLPEKMVLEKAENCGIGFWSKRSEIRSEKIKNALLYAMPQLKWAAITTKGCTATIHLEEERAHKSQNKSIPMNLVSATDGIVQEITVLRGTPLCKVGDAVIKGQLLVSGYTDCGLSIQVTGAEGEVYALTQRSLHAMAMKPISTRKNIAEFKRVYSLQIGKKLIKLFKDSGILDSSCVKIKSTKNIRLPGGNYLPVALVKEVWYSSLPCTDTEVDFDYLKGIARNYITDHMQAGEIIKEDISVENLKDTVRLNGAYACREMIGQTMFEEFTGIYGEND